MAFLVLEIGLMIDLREDNNSMSQLENRIQFLKNSKYVEHFQALSVPQPEILVWGVGGHGDDWFQCGLGTGK